MADYALKVNVTTEMVREKADQIATQKALMEQIMNDMQSKVTQTETCFNSTAGEAYRQQYTNVAKNIKNSLEALMTHVTNLKEVALKYETKNEENKTKASSLSGDGIFN